MLAEHTSTPLAGALDAAARGWKLIRLEPAGKMPAGKWRGRETSDPGTVRSWFRGDAEPNYGIVADASGLLILDEDTPGALDAWAASSGVDLPATFTVATGKGRHSYFTAGGVDYGNGTPFKAAGFDVDVRGAGYVVGPGSVHGATGALYTVTDDRDPVPVPAGLHDYLTRPPERPVERPIASAPVAGASGMGSWLTAAVRGVLRDLAACQSVPLGAEPRWDRTTYAAARRLVELSNGSHGTYPLDQARTDYLATAPTDATFGPAQHAHKWDDAVQEGGTAEPPAPREDDRLTAAEAAAFTTGAPMQDPVASGPAAPRDRFAPLDWTDVLTGPPPAEDWMLWPLAERGQSVSLYSAPKVGKSLLMLDLLTDACAGRPVLGRRPAPPLRVLYLDAENTRKDLRKRLHDLGAAPEALAGLVYLSFPPLAPLDTARGATELLELVDRHRPDLVVIDTVSRFIDGPENDADTWLNVYRLTLAPLKARQVAVIRLDHAGKDADRGERGSSAKNGDVDASWQLTHDEGRQTRTLTRKLTRTGNGPERLVLNVETGPLRHTPASPLDVAADPASHFARKLDELGAPWGESGIGRDAAGKMLRDAGHGGFTKAVLTAAVARRKEPGYRPADLPAASGQVPARAGLPAGSGQVRSGQGVSAGQDLPGGVGQGVPDAPSQTCLPALPSIGGRARAGARGGDVDKPLPRLCEVCGEPLAPSAIEDGFSTHPACDGSAR